MHNPWPQHIIDAGKRGMRQQAVDQRAIRMPRRWMHHHALGFVDDNHLVIFVHNIQWHRFRFGFQWRRRWRIKADLVTELNFFLAFGSLAIKLNQTRREPFLHLRAGKIRILVGNHLIQPAALGADCEG